MAKVNSKIDVKTVREQMFLLWCMLLLIYILLILSLGTSFKAGVEFEDVSNYAWSVAYLFVPVLGAFAGFWFNQSQRERTKRVRIEKDYRKYMFILTGVLHGLVFLWYLFAVALEDFTDQERMISFEGRMDSVLKILLLIWSTTLLPVTWILEGTETPDKSTNI